jgi:hypothetical protein
VAWVRARAEHVRFVVDEVAGFLWVLRFPLPIIIPQNFPSSQSPAVDTIDLVVPTVLSEPNWTPPPTTRICQQSNITPQVWRQLDLTLNSKTFGIQFRLTLSLWK